MEDLLRETEYIEELEKMGIPLTGRTLRNYVVKGIHPTPIKIAGQGNVLLYQPDWVDRVKVISQLVKEGETLDSIRSILTSAKASDQEILDYISTRNYLDIRRHAIKQLKKGKTLNAVMKDKIIVAKEKFRKGFDRKFGEGRYERFTNDFFHILSKYKQLYPNEWDKDDILDYFDFKPETVDFTDRKAVRLFKMNFFKKLKQFLRERCHGFEEDIKLYDKSIKGYEEINKKV